MLLVREAPGKAAPFLALVMRVCSHVQALLDYVVMPLGRVVIVQALLDYLLDYFIMPLGQNQDKR